MKRIEKVDGIVLDEKNQKLAKVNFDVNLKGLPNEEYDISSIEVSRTKVLSLTNSLKRRRMYKELYSEMLDTAKPEDLIDLVVDEYIMSGGKYRTKQSRDEHYKREMRILNRTKYFSINEIAKKIASMYFEKMVEGFPDKEVEKCDKLLHNGTTPMELLKDLGIKFSELSIENGYKDLSAQAFANEIHEAYIKVRHHLCGDCPLGAHQCPKLFDYEWKNIGEYPFIIDGVQMLDKNGDISQMYVYNCEFFDRAKKPKTIGTK